MPDLWLPYDRPTPHWIVRRVRRKDGTLFNHSVWEAIDPDGNWSGDFGTWAEAMSWATDPYLRLDYYRMHSAAWNA